MNTYISKREPRSGGPGLSLCAAGRIAAPEESCCNVGNAAREGRADEENLPYENFTC